MIRILVISLVLSMGYLPAGAKAPTYRVSKADVEKLSADMQGAFAGLQYLLNAYQTRQFFSLPDDGTRREWIDRFWQLNDPTPTTPENEMRIEHLIRAAVARRSFASTKWPGWDRRGEVFIRYGPPDFRGKIWGEVTLRGFHPPGEMWYYRRHNMLMSFQRAGKDDEYIYAIEPLGAAENMSPGLAEYLLYDTSEGLAGKIPQDLLEFYTAPTQDEAYRRLGEPAAEQDYLQSKPRDLPEDIDAIMDPNLPYELPKDISAVFEKDKVREIANNFQVALEETPSSYPFNFNRRELPFFFGVDQFRAGENTNRVEVQIEVPVSVEGGESFEETYHADVVLWDSQFNEVGRRERDIVLRAAPVAAQWTNLLPTQVVFSLAGGYYRMAVTVHGGTSGRESSYRTSFSCQSFGPKLAVSDILFARKIAQTEESSIFTRGALEVIPHPFRGYSRSFPLPLYFEIYNLRLDSRGVSSYTTEYRIIPRSKAKKDFWERFAQTPPIVASRFESSGYGGSETQHIFVRTENLAKGSYEILITVTDDLSKDVAYRKGTFSIVD